MKLLISICLTIVLIIVNVSNAQQCWNKNDLSWRSGNNKLTLNGVPITIQGVAWFGMETGTFSPGGLQTTSVEALLDLMVQMNFNALRLPFSVDMILNNRYPNHINFQLNPNLKGKTALEILQYITVQAGNRGILVVLEQHRFDPSDYISALWYSTECITNVDGQCINYTEEMVIQSWITLTNLFKQYWNLWGLDIKNEPHDPCTWGSGNLETDWDKAFKRISDRIASATGFNGVYFIEGVQNNNAICSNMYNNWWGGNVSPVQCFPINLDEPDRLVYAPHTYCSSVFDQEYFQVGNYPENMPTVWDSQFGFLADSYYPVILGEWGCKINSTKNQKWMDRFVQYLNDKNIKNHLFFSLNPDSADTDSPLSADWKTINQNTVTVLKKINPNPTKFTLNGNQICIGQVSTISSSTTTSGSSSITGSGSSSSTTGSGSSSSTTGSGSSSSTTKTLTSGSASTTTGSSSTTTSGSSSSITGSGSSSSTTGSGSSSSTTGSGSSSSTTGPSSGPLIVKQEIRQTWFDGTNENILVDCTVTNPSNSAKALPVFLVDKEPSSVWQINQVGTNRYSMSTWNNQIDAGQTLIFGYIVASNNLITFTQI